MISGVSGASSASTTASMWQTRRFAAALAASHYLRSSAPEGSAGLGILPGLAQSWITAVLCTLPFMANHGTGRGEEEDRHTRGLALLRPTWNQSTSAFSPPGTERRIGLLGVVSFGQPCPSVGFAPDVDDAMLYLQMMQDMPETHLWLFNQFLCNGWQSVRRPDRQGRYLDGPCYRTDVAVISVSFF